MDGGGRNDESLIAPRGDRAESYARALVPVAPPKRRAGWAVPRGAGSALVLTFLAVAATVGAVQGGHVAEARRVWGEPHHVAARILGFALDRIVITGQAELTEAEILAASGLDRRHALPFVDAVAVRERLTKLPLVRDVTVKKLYPGDLIIQISERRAYALWQRNGEVSVIAEDGTPIEPLRDARFNELPLVVGDKANEQARAFVSLVEAAGELKPRIVAGTLIAGRRWNLKLTNGIIVKVPEEDAETAMRRLAQLERDTRILERDILVVDLRQPDRVTVRLGSEAAEQRREIVKQKLARARGNNA